MNPNAVFSATLVSSLLLWFPSMQACLRGDLDLTPAALRYLAALTLSRLAMNSLARLVNAYRAAQLPAPGTSPTEGESAGPPADADPAVKGRRRSDRKPGNGTADPASLAA